jgi:predicted metal-dependent hydrolase
MKSHITPAQELRRRALAWAVKLRVNPRVVHVRDMRRKWGSCSVKGTITLSWDLTEAVAIAEKAAATPGVADVISRNFG